MRCGKCGSKMEIFYGIDIDKFLNDDEVDDITTAAWYCSNWKCRDSREIFNEEKKNWREFELNDEFNGNVLKGYICMVPSYKYGAVYISHVNGKCTPQFIWGAPKMHYPFDKSGKFDFPSADSIEIYEKLDGTNILAYEYEDSDDNKFVAFKTRMVPVLNRGNQEDFLGMFNEMLQKYPGIPEWVKSTGLNLSFEMFGFRNYILLYYPVELDINLLFGVTKDAEIISPSSIDNPTDVKVVTMNARAKTSSKLIEFYQEQKETLGSGLKEEDEGFVGAEGQIWYFIKDGRARQIKCKPHEIEKIHFKAGGIDNNSIRTTVINAWEQGEDPPYDIIKELLLEEYSESDIAKKSKTIKNIMDDIFVEKRTSKVFLAKYDEWRKEDQTINIHDDKGRVMRLFAEKMREEYGKRLGKMSQKFYGIVKRNR